MPKDLLDRTGDEILDAVDEGLARKPAAVIFTGQPLTADDIIAALDALPPEVRRRPVVLQADEPRTVVAVGPQGILLTEVLPF